MYMKKITLSAAVVLLFMVACKTGQKTTSTDTASAKTETAAPAAEAALSADLAAAATKRYPFVPQADIAEGQKIYNGKCGKCHGLPDVDARTEEKWPKTMDWMAPKANLDEKQKQQALQYVLCALDVKKAGK
jgi:mono/diheme cytochrome c family protein